LLKIQFSGQNLILETVKPGQYIQGIRGEDSSYVSSPDGQLSRCTDKQQCLNCGGIYDGDGNGNPDPNDVCNQRNSSQVSCYCKSTIDFDTHRKIQ
jgi:hypothetical protein